MVTLYAIVKHCAHLPNRWPKFWPVKNNIIGGGKSAHRVRKKEKRQMSTTFFREEYRGFYIMQVNWSHPEICDNLKHFTMEEIEGRWAGHTIGSKMTIKQCADFIDQLLDWRKNSPQLDSINVEKK